MIKLSNGHRIEYMTASGSLGFGVKGWPWEWPLVWLGFIKPNLFTIVVKSLTIYGIKGNLRWWKPWTCVRPIPGGSVNKIGLTNKGFEWWCRKVATRINFNKNHVVVSIFGTRGELIKMATALNVLDDLVAIEINVSCPNKDNPLQTEEIIGTAKAVHGVSIHPILLKLGVEQEYLAIARGLARTIEGITFNSVRWETVFPGKRSPLWRLERKVGGGGGGVSGRPAQKYNWEAVEKLAVQGLVPVIAPSIMEFDDIVRVERLGASAISFGAIHLPDCPLWRKPWTIFTNPVKPTRFVKRLERLVRREKKEDEEKKARPTGYCGLEAVQRFFSRLLS